MAPSKTTRQTRSSARGSAETRQSSAQGGTPATLPPIRPQDAEKLDPWFEGVSQPSQRIQEMAKRKRLKHDALLRQLRQELFRERTAAERTVSFISSNLRTELDKASLMVKLKGKELDELCERLCAAATTGLQEQGQGERGDAFKEAVAAACDVVQQLTEQRTRAVDAFYDLLLDVESEHQKRAKDAFRKYGEALQRNGHLPPQRMQPVLDSEMKEVSELHLRHVISFGDLRLCLNMHAERDCRKFGDALDRSRSVHRERCQRAAVSALQSVPRDVLQALMAIPHRVEEAVNRASDEHIGSTLMGREALHNFQTKMEHLETSLLVTNSYPFSSDEINRWEIGVKYSLQKLDACVETICNSFKEALGLTKMNSMKEIKRLKEFLIGSNLCSNDNFETLCNNVCMPLLNILDQKLAGDPTSLQKDWKQMFIRLHSQIDSLTSLLKDAGKLWENYSQLQETCRMQTLKSLHAKIQDRGKYVEAKERRVTLIIEASHRETKKKIIEENVTRIFKILDEVKLSYESMHKQEREIIEGHTLSITHELQSLNSLKVLFLEKHQKCIVQKNCVDKHTVEILNKSEGLLVHIELEENRWHDNIRSFLVNQCENSVHQSEQKWIKQQIQKLQEEYDCIAETHKLRYNQIETCVQVTRLAELSEHDRIFSSQKEVITSVSTNIQRELENTFVKMFQAFQHLNSQMKSLNKDGLNVSSIQTVKNTIDEVQNRYENCKESVKCLNEEFHIVVMQQMQDLKNNNQIMVESLKLFSDGGNYAESEVKNMRTEIRNLELELEANVIKKGLSLKQKSKECCSEALKHVKICSQDLQVYLDNLTFTECIISIVEKTQSQLNKHVLALKYGGKLLHEQSTKLVESCVRGDISDIQNEWRCVTETISKRCKLLLDNEASDEEHGALVLSASTLVQYGESNAFLPTVHNILKESAHQIKTAVENFHQGKDCYNSLKVTVLQDEVTNYMSEISAKYKIYQEQCIEAWMWEVKGLLDSIKMLSSNHDICCDKNAHSFHEHLLVSLQVERNQLNENLVKLRASYQQHQVDTMAKLGSTQKYLGHQFSALCSQFETTSGVLSENIKNLIDKYMQKAHNFLMAFEEKTREHHIIVVETMQYLSGELAVNMLLKIEKEVLHIYKYYSFKLPASTALFRHKDSNKPGQGIKYRSACSPAIVSALKNLCTAADQFWASCKQVEMLNNSWKPESLQRTAEGNLQEARKLVESKTSEVKKLYEQYKTMTAELRMKWRSTSDNIQRINAPICSPVQYK